MKNSLFQKSLHVVGFSSLIILFGFAAGCGGSGGGGSSGGGSATVEGVSMPSSVSVVTAQNADQVQ